MDEIDITELMLKDERGPSQRPSQNNVSQNGTGANGVTTDANGQLIASPGGPS